MRYGAFLSYSHADESVARWILRRLEGYRVPSRLAARTLQGDLELREGNVTGARNSLAEARHLLLAGVVAEVPFPRLDALIRALLLLGQPDQAAPHLQRLERAGYVPLRPFPDGGLPPLALADSAR